MKFIYRRDIVSLYITDRKLKLKINKFRDIIN